MPEQKELRVELIRHTLSPEEVIALGAKLCYSRATVEDLKNRIEEKDQSSFIEKLLNMGHESVFEHACFYLWDRRASAGCFLRSSPGIAWQVFPCRVSAMSAMRMVSDIFFHRRSKRLARRQSMNFSARWNRFRHGIWDGRRSLEAGKAEMRTRALSSRTHAKQEPC